MFTPTQTASSMLVSCYRARFHECDPHGHVNNAVLVGYLEQAGMDYLAAGGWSFQRTRACFDSVFVTRRYQVECHQPASENDVLRVSTVGVEVRGARAVASYELHRVQAEDPLTLVNQLMPAIDHPTSASEDLIVSATSVYAFTNLETKPPTRMSSEIMDDFFAGN